MTDQQQHHEQQGGQLSKRYQTVRAVVTRADGTVEDRGIVSFYHHNPLINMVGAPLARLNGWVQERLAQRRRKQ